MFSVWDGIAMAVGVVAIGLTFIDHHVLRREIERLRDQIRQWEIWGRLVCEKATGADLAIPDPPQCIDNG